MQCRTWSGSFPWHQGWTNPIKNYECFQHGVASGEEPWSWRVSAEVPRGGVPCAPHSWVQMPSARQRFQRPAQPIFRESPCPKCLFLLLGKRCCSNTLPLETAGMEGAAAPPIKCSSISQASPQAAPGVQGWSTHQTWLWLPP